MGPTKQCFLSGASTWRRLVRHAQSSRLLLLTRYDGRGRKNKNKTKPPLLASCYQNYPALVTGSRNQYCDARPASPWTVQSQDDSLKCQLIGQEGAPPGTEEPTGPTSPAKVRKVIQCVGTYKFMIVPSEPLNVGPLGLNIEVEPMHACSSVNTCIRVYIYTYVYKKIGNLRMRNHPTSIVFYLSVILYIC